jgi:hypothetical protein
VRGRGAHGGCGRAGTTQGANYRLIDIPVSNCINSNVNKIYCLTQFNSASLNRHLSMAYVRPLSRSAARPPYQAPCAHNSPSLSLSAHTGGGGHQACRKQ